MGRQINFYMLPLEDEKLFLDHVLSDTNVIIISGGSFNQPTPIMIEPDWLIASDLSQVFFWNRIYPLASLLIHPGDPSSGTFYLGSRLIIPVIEYDRCFIRDTDNKLVKGRIWAETKFWTVDETQGDVLVSKGDAFIAWYEDLATWLRKNLRREKGISGYIGKQAREWYRNGGELEVY